MSDVARSVLPIAGFLIGGTPGYLVGTVLGALLFPVGAKAQRDDLAGMTLAGPTPGTPLAILLGTRRVPGRPTWKGPIHRHETGGKKGGGGGGKGGKGGGGDDVTYSQSFMHTLVEGGPAMTLLRIWNGDDLLWEGSAVAPVGTAGSVVTTRNPGGIDFTFHSGTIEQEADARMASYGVGGASVGDQSVTYTETTTLNGAAPSFALGHVPVTAGTDVVFATGGAGAILNYFTRVASAPGQDEYTIDDATGVLAFGGSYAGIAITIRYQVAGAGATQEALAYPGVCYVYVHEFNSGATQSIAQLTYELSSGEHVIGRYGVYGYTQKVWTNPLDTDPPPYTRNRFLRVRGDGVYEQLGLWGDVPLAGGGEGGSDADIGKWRVTSLIFSVADQHWYLGALQYSGALTWTVESAVFRTPTLPPPGTFASPGAGVTRLAHTSFTGSWAGFAEEVWDPTIGPDGRVYFCRDVPDHRDVISVGAADVVELGTPATVTSMGSLTLHGGRVWWAGVTGIGALVVGYLDGVSFVTVSTTSGPTSVNGGESLRMEDVGGRLYISGGSTARTYRLDESTMTWVLQTGVGLVEDWYEAPFSDEIFGVGTGFVASTPLSTISDAWTLRQSGLVDGLTGVGSLEDGQHTLHVLRRTPGAQTRLQRLEPDDSLTTLATLPDGGGTLSRMLAPGFIPGEPPLSPGLDVPFPWMVREIMTHARFGAGLDVALVNLATYDVIEAWAIENDLLGSALIENTTSALQAIEAILTHYFGWLAVVQGRFVFGARRPETITRELVLDDALESGEMTFALPGERDTRNRIRIDFTDRSQRYNVAPVYVSDDDDRTRRGERPENIQLDFYTRAEPVKMIAATMLALRSVPQAGFEVTLGPKEIALAPGDPIAVTSVRLGYAQEPCRIISIGESEDRGEFKLQIAQEPAAALILRTFPIQEPNPGDPPSPATQDPGPTIGAVWEMPPELVGDDVLRTMFVLGSTGHPDWRGASVYLSLDGGISFDRVLTYLGAPARIGAASSELPATDLEVFASRGQLDVDVRASSGTLVSVARNTALADGALGLVGGEPFDYRDAELQSSGRYRLRGLFRGRFEQVQADVAAGSLFAFIGSTPVFPTLDHPLDRIGLELQVKFASINRSGVEQDPAGLPVFTFTLQGLARRPSPIYGLQLELAGIGQGSRRIIDGGAIDVRMIWRYARRDNPENADLVDGIETAEKAPDWLDYEIQVFSKAAAGDDWTARRTAHVTSEGYTYTAAANAADAGAYRRFVRFDVYSRRSNGALSRARTLAIEVLP